MNAFFPDPQFLNQKSVFSCLVAQKRWDFLLFLIVNNGTLRLSSNFNQIHDYFPKKKKLFTFFKKNEPESCEPIS